MNNTKVKGKERSTSDDEQLALPSFSCSDYLDGVDLDDINSMFESSGWDYSAFDDDEGCGISTTEEGTAEKEIMQSISSKNKTGDSTLPTGSEILQNCGTTPSCIEDNAKAYCTTVPESNMQHNSFNTLYQQHQLFLAGLTAVPAASGSFVSQQLQQNVILNIQQLKQLTESMRRSEITRRQVHLQRQAMAAAAQQKQQMKPADTESMQNMSNWLGSRISQSKRQLQSYANTMRYFDIVHG